MARSIGFRTALGAGAILLGLALALPRAFAVEDTDDSSGTKASKSCPSGKRYSEKKHGCVKHELRNRANLEQRRWILRRRQLGVSDR